MSNPAAELISEIQDNMSHEAQTTRAMKCKKCVEGKKCRHCESCKSEEKPDISYDGFRDGYNDDANCEVSK